MAFDSSADQRRRPVDVKNDPGGERGAFSDGVLRVLTPVIDYGTLVGRSAGGVENMLLATAQHQAYRSVNNAGLDPSRVHQGFPQHNAKAA